MILLSSDPLANFFPSLLKEIELTLLLWFGNWIIFSFFLTSHNIIVLSDDPLANIDPSLLNAI